MPKGWHLALRLPTEIPKTNRARTVSPFPSIPIIARVWTFLHSKLKKAKDEAKEEQGNPIEPSFSYTEIGPLIPLCGASNQPERERGRATEWRTSASPQARAWGSLFSPRSELLRRSEPSPTPRAKRAIKDDASPKETALAHAQSTLMRPM